MAIVYYFEVFYFVNDVFSSVYFMLASFQKLRIRRLLHPVEIHGYGHHGESQRHDDGVSDPDGVEQVQITVIVQSHRPESALESVEQVVCQRDTGHDIYDNNPAFLKGLLHQGIKVMYFRPIVIGHGTDIRKAGGDPELFPVDEEEYQDNGSQQAHGTGIPFTAPVAHWHL